jgi:hypothetical protein
MKDCVGEVVIDTGKIVSPQKPCGACIPPNLEVRIVSFVKRVRQ